LRFDTRVEFFALELSRMPMAASSECDIYAGEVRYTTRATPSDHALRCSCCAERLMRK